MSRVINPDSAGKQRNKLIRLTALTVRELLRQPEPNDDTRDMAIFIVLSLDTIAADFLIFSKSNKIVQPHAEFLFQCKRCIV